MKRMVFVVLCTLFIADSSTTLASAEKAARFERADLNSDGIITLEEMDQNRLARFSKADADGSGSITRAELEAVVKGRMAKHLDRIWNRMDRDGDGEISPAESQKLGARRFAMMDTDGDGGISREEMQAGHKKRQSRSEPAE